MPFGEKLRLGVPSAEAEKARRREILDDLLKSGQDREMDASAIERLMGIDPHDADNRYHPDGRPPMSSYYRSDTEEEIQRRKANLNTFLEE